MKQHIRIFTVKEFIAAGVLPPLTFLKKKHRRRVIEYAADIITFDTEFTSIARLDDYTCPRARYKKKEKKWITQDAKIKAFGLLYLWQACVFGQVVMGRTLDEWRELWDYIQKSYCLGEKRRICVYVHNLECDFCFLQGWTLKWDVFAPNIRAVLTAYADGLEFRCSYKLSNMSLDKFCQSEGTKTRKQDGGQYDYSKLRTPKTHIEGFELYYAYCDVMGLYEAVRLKMEHNGDTIATIPLTSTGYIRRDIRGNMAINPRNFEQFKMCAIDADRYKMLRDAFRGGNTHANRFFAGRICTWRMESGKYIPALMSFDKTSDYPSAMIYELFPSGPLTEKQVSSMDELIAFENSGWGYVCECEFYDLETTAYIPYISSDKTDIKTLLSRDGFVFDNGRILKAPGRTVIKCIDIDIKIIRNTYTYSAFKVLKCYRYRMKPLPLEFRKTIIEYFAKKTQLKGVEGQEYFYNKSKNSLNGGYGITVQASAPFPIKLNDGIWREMYPEDVDEFYDEHLKRFFKSRNNFLPYQVGVYVSAYGRQYLQEAIDICGPKIVYCDTDSVKFIYDENIAEALLDINKRIEQQALTCGVDAIQESEKAGRQVLGVWDREKDYHEFITLGAKKYAYTYRYFPGDKKTEKRLIKSETHDYEITFNGETQEFQTVTEEYEEYKTVYKEVTDEFHITVAGLPKKAAKFFGSVDMFQPGFVVEDSGRKIAVYDDNIKPHYIEVDGDRFELRGNMAILDTSYTLDVTDDYENVISNSIFEDIKLDDNIRVMSSMAYDPK